MKYNAIRIEGGRCGRGVDKMQWCTRIFSDEVEREDGYLPPSPHGWFYCPETRSVSWGFNLLKKTMIKAHKEELIRIQHSLEELIKLELSDEFKKIKGVKRNGQKTSK